MIHIRRLVAHNFKQLEQIELDLPRRGRFLVQGPNESGKSTLFEAVYFGLFGRPLTTETAHLRLDDVIRYDTEAAWVQLEVELPAGRRLVITRRIRRGRPNVWELDVVDAAGQVEEIRSNNAVNERIEAELRLDGESLLNTCFVEQKKLEKLEGLGRREREQSLMKLLNLDRLVALEEELKVRPADVAQVARRRDRAELARRRADLPLLAARLAEVTAALACHEVHAELVATVAAVEAVAALAADLAAARAGEAAARERLAEVERLQVGRTRWRDACTARDRSREAAVEAERLALELAAAERVRDEALPAVIGRGRAVQRLRRRWGLIQRLETEQAEGGALLVEVDARLAQAAADRETLNEVRRGLVAARAAARDAQADLEALDGDRRAFEVRDALVGWLDARGELAAMPEPGGTVDTLHLERAAAVRRGRLMLMALGAVALVVLGLWRWLAPALLPAAWWSSLLALGGLGAWRWAVLARREQELVAAAARREGEAASHEREHAALAGREAAAAARLTELNAVRPADDERAGLAVRELDGRLAGRDRAAAGAARERARTALAEALAEGRGLEAREAQLRATAGRFDAAALGRERDALAERLRRLDAVLARRRPAVAALADGLGLALDAGQIAGELGALKSERRTLRAQADQVPALSAERVARQEAVARHLAAAAAAWAGLPAVSGVPAWSPGLTEAEVTSAGAGLDAAYAAAGGDGVRPAAEAAAREAARLTGEHGAASRSVQARLTALGARAGELRPPLALPAHPDRAALAGAAAALAAGLAGDPAALAAEREAVARSVNVTRHEMERLEVELGLAGEALDPAIEAAAWTAAARDLEVRERAVQVVTQAGRAVVQRVLPSTIEHMRRLLPGLTAGRYFDAELTDDYRIQVLDERAGAWKQKNIFSGGTKDQFSLALRLAFALATLPEERGAAPSFLFLDEPLGAFDESRAQALVDLLTTGEVAASFEQIFLISHVRVDEAAFDYHITLAEGRVVESTLPADTTTDSLATPARVG